MGIKAEPRYPDRAAMAKHLRWIAGTLLIIAAPAMIVGTRSSPLFLAAAAMLAAAVALVERRGRMAAEEIGQAFLTPLGMASLAFLAWALASLLWSSSPATTALSLLEALVPAASALIIAVGLSGQTRHFSSRTAALGLAFGLAVACAAMLLDLGTGMSLQRALGSRPQGFVLNRAVLMVLVVSTPVLWWLARDRLLPPSVYLAFGGLLAGSVISSHSGAAVVGGACALLIYGLARYAPRSAVGALLIGAFLSLAAAPIIGETMFRSISKAAHERMAGASSEARVAIWRSFEVVVRERPLLGWGFGVSPVIADDPRVRQIDSDTRAMLGVGHPHNAALQIWVELGAVGAALAFLVFAFLLRSIARLDAGAAAPRLALVAGAGMVALVGHGAWQGWWIACLGLAAVLFRTASEAGEDLSAPGQAPSMSDPNLPAPGRPGRSRA
ncbi:MAG: O-antigen ligase family protein [Microvirga sp.]